MAEDGAFDRSRAGAPLGAFALAVVAGVEPKPGDDAEDVAAPGIERDPLAFAGLSETAELVTGDRFTQQAGVVQDIGCRARAIVADVLHAAMAAAVDVGFADEMIPRRDGALH